MEFEEQGNNNIAQINVTPFVDVMLVLLVIFMVTTPIMQQGVNVELPSVEAGALTKQADELLVVSVDREGDIHLNDNVLQLTLLKQRMSAIVKIRSDRTVYLRADARVPYGRVVTVMAAIREAGVQKIGMVTEALPNQDGKGGGKE